MSLNIVISANNQVKDWPKLHRAHNLWAKYIVNNPLDLSAPLMLKDLEKLCLPVFDTDGFYASSFQDENTAMVVIWIIMVIIDRYVMYWGLFTREL